MVRVMYWYGVASPFERQTTYELSYRYTDTLITGTIRSPHTLDHVFRIMSLRLSRGRRRSAALTHAPSMVAAVRSTA